MQNARHLVAIVLMAGTAGFTGSAWAQDWSDPEGGEEAPSTWSESTPPPPPPAPAATPSAATPPAATAAQPGGGWGDPDATSSGSGVTGTSDHAKYAAKHLGIGYFGIATLPYGFTNYDFSAGSPNVTATSMDAPLLGMRIWFSELFGLEVALGLGLTSNSGDAGNTSVDLDSSFGLAAHVGMPLALFHASHAKFLLIPEVNFGLTDGSGPSQSGGAAGQEDLYSGMLFQGGARVGTEIHFGFIDIPELAVQATVGLLFSYSSREVDACTDSPATGNCTNVVVSQSGVNLNTTVNADPVDIITSSIGAIYYF